MKARQDYSIELRDLTLAYGERDIIRGLNLDVRRGEILSLLGPSGCGKTTTLHAIAGLIVPRKGSVVIDGVDQTDVAINRRNVGMVFQGYALFPHMTVFDNVSYGLRIKSVAKAEVRERTMRALALVGMEQYAQRKPRQLSGGQQQRVAIARTMVMEPRVLLLDEPLSNLDAKLRHEIRGDLKRILRELSITSVFVTHDQEEAMFLSDRIVLMKDGAIAQLSSPREIYNNPANSFAAAFLGNTNFIAATLLSQTPDHTGCEVSATETGQVLKGRSALRFDAQQPGFLSVKHDRVSYTLSHEEFLALRDRPGISTMQCRVADVHFLGHVTKVECQAGDQTMTVLRSSACVPPDLAAGAAIYLYWPEEESLVLSL
ncbi:ABC transporter ATP-binding protein [Bordetella parapertussis]|uniref:ABC transporter ATP-binding protein n=2 Tax=Bordetella parapertussis TaxID=519 RepID=A0ABU5X841_BORPP|nr:ABC transporter ATP-binding protein [Bordetella parapertussis]AOB38194.1 ABC transporter ATP-binding protein [Bordetella parapertussis]AUL42168.1 ABC transporter ATP-binding protein [Bordetella parapertussis]AWP62084.1 ABC transporter ATP-binding protein [Bordetella parapertussis]AWP69581.1 ABC transporter ATP-binding protein [Bordetella parapertussis]AWP88171.1 ABC transporter ATP-binding protein [Bordetella parapertussis]